MLDQGRERRHRADAQVRLVPLDKGEIQTGQIDNAVHILPLPRLQRCHQMRSPGQGHAPRCVVSKQIERLRQRLRFVILSKNRHNCGRWLVVHASG